MQKKKAVLIEANDNVLTVLEPVEAGEIVSTGVEEVCSQDEIPQYHKIARTNIACGSILYKYGQPMGYAIVDIQKGQWVHTHNADSELPEGGCLL